MTDVHELLRSSDPVDHTKLSDLAEAPVFDELFQAIVAGADDLVVALPTGQPDPADTPHHKMGRPHHAALVSLAVAAALLIALVAVPALRAPARSRGAVGHTGPIVGTPRKPLAWRLVGDVSPAWHVQPSSGFEPGFYLTCPTTTTCYAGNIRAGAPGQAADLEVTHDGGETWQQIALPVSLSYASRLVCLDALTCAILGVDNSGSSYLFLTTSGGQSWTSTPGPSDLTSTSGIADLSCTTASSCVAVASDPGGPTGAAEAYVTKDAGSTWTEANLPQDYVPGPGALQCIGSSMCASVGFVQSPEGSSGPPSAMALYSTDGGLTWTTASLPVTTAAFLHLSCADASDCMATFFAKGTQDGVLVSYDGGETWSETASSPQAFKFGISCPSASDCWTSGLAPRTAPGQPETVSDGSGIISSTTDGGNTWQDATLPTGIGPVIDISCPSDTSCSALALEKGQNGQPLYPFTVVLLSYGS
jgi:photosystem II stability/assembly factor-like uncharacterized protein